jgi:hypothetical protein
MKKQNKTPKETEELKTLKEKELYMRNWFLRNELYSDGSNVRSWQPKLKEMLEDVFKVNLSENGLK